MEQQKWINKILYQVNAQTGKQEITPNPQMWCYPPAPIQKHGSSPASPDAYFLEPFFFWAQQRIWAVDLRCTKECQAKQDEKKVKVGM